MMALLFKILFILLCHVVNTHTIIHLPYMYTFSRDIIFKVFAVNWLSVKFSSLKFHWQNFGLHQSESRILSDPQKQNRENAGFVTSSKSTCLENLCVYSISNHLNYNSVKQCNS